MEAFRYRRPTEVNVDSSTRSNLSKVALVDYLRAAELWSFASKPSLRRNLRATKDRSGYRTESCYTTHEEALY